MRIQRHRRRLANGEERVYSYAVGDDGQSISLGSSDSSSSLSTTVYRKAEKRRICAALLADSSLLVVGESGCGKTFLANAVVSELEEQGFVVARIGGGTVKQIFLDLAEQLGVDTESIEGKQLTTHELQEAIAEWLENNTALLICDNAHRLSVSLRNWLEKLYNQGQAMLLLATHPPARDIFIKLPRIELEPMSDRAIREIMEDMAMELDLELTPGKLASLQQRTGGNPMLAKRVVIEEYLGLDGKALDHTQFFDGTPLLVAGLMCFMIIRFLGLGFNNTSLYLLGGIITTGVGVTRIMLYSLPRKSNKLGQ